MSITPDEVEHRDLPRTWFRGYQRRSIDELLENIAESVAAVKLERAHLSDRVEELEAEVASSRELETLLRSTLVAAERAAQEMSEQARRESDLIVHEAHAESRRVTREATAEKRRLEEDMTKIRAQLRVAFELLGERPQDESTSREDVASVTEQGAIGEALESGLRKVVS